MYSITLPPREPGTSDAEWVQHEIDSHESETVFELVGEFDFANETVTVTRGLTLHGVAIEESEEPTTIIIGGGEPYDNVDDPEDPLIGANLGAFRVISDGPVVFQDLLFRRWIGEAVLVQACDGLTVKRCYFTEPVPGSLGQRLGSLTFANAVLANGGFCKGDLIFENNCGRFSYSGDMPNDEGLLACLDTNFSSMQASHNDLTGHDEGLEIIRNGWGLENFDIPIILRDNTFTLLESLPIGWPGHAACMCLNNHNARTEIVDNSITLRGEGTAFALSGEHFEVRDNDLTLESRWRVLNRRGPMMREYPTAFQLGTDLQPEGFGDLCSSVANSWIVNNTIRGDGQYAIKMPKEMQVVNAEPVPNNSHDNHVLGNELSGFRPSVASLYLTQLTSDNHCEGCFPGRSILDDGVINEGDNPEIINACPPVRVHTDATFKPDWRRWLWVIGGVTVGGSIYSLVRKARETAHTKGGE